jgi:aspartate kinase
MLVAKFGGTSVGSPERLRAVAEILRGIQDPQVVAVVSALSGTTSALIAAARAAAAGDVGGYHALKDELSRRHLTMAHELLANSPELPAIVAHIERRLADLQGVCDAIALLGELTMRGHDAVASIGEELSSRMLAALLRSQGRSAQAVSATELVQTDASFGSARPDMAATRQRTQTRLGPLLDQGILPVVTGYIGATADGLTTTLGRGGSDYSAAIMGVALDADQVWIWTDVNGILTADPKLVPQAHTLPELSYAEAEELAYFGANVLHPKTVVPLAQAGIDLRVLNSFQPEHPGTLISSQPSPRRQVLPAIISTENLSLVEVSGNGVGWSLVLAARALQTLAEAGLEVFMFSQAFSERSLNLVIPRHDQTHGIRVLERALERELRAGTISHIGVEEQVAAISVVGMPDLAGEPIIPRAFAALGKLGVRIVSVAQASSQYSVSFIIAEQDVARAVPFIHAELGL